MNNSNQSFDKNSIIGLTVISAILIGYFIMNRPSEEDLMEARAKRDSIEAVEKARTDSLERIEEPVKAEVIADSAEKGGGITETSPDTNASPEVDSLQKLKHKEKFGIFSNAAEGEENEYIIENEKMKVYLSSKGGKVAAVELKDYSTYDSLPLFIFDQDSTVFDMNFFTKNNKSFSTNNMYFNTDDESFVVTGKEDSSSFSMRMYTDRGEDQYIEYVYTLKGNSYNLDFDFNIVGLKDEISPRVPDFSLYWKISTPDQEKTIDNQNMATTTYYKYYEDEVDYISEAAEEEKVDMEMSVKWVAFKEQFFSAALIADKYFEKANSEVYSKTYGEESEDYVKHLSTRMTIPYNYREEEQFGMKFYFGPNHFQTLKKQGYELSELVPLGWGILGWVNRWLVIPVFNFLDSFNLNYGIIILLLTLFIKLLLSPITYKTYLSSARMRVLKPEIEKINKKFEKADAMKKQQATMSLYRQTGVNPMAGCVPMLIQFPILIAMFRFFPASIELRQESFLWADDLSTYDSIFQLPFNIPFYGDHVSLFTLLMAASMYFYTKMNGSMTSSPGGASGPMAGQMKFMMYMMPFMMLFFFNSYSAGLSYYYFLSNIISIGQTVIIRKWIVDEDAIREKIEKNKKKKKGKKKSKFQKRLEEMNKKRGKK